MALADLQPHLDGQQQQSKKRAVGGISSVAKEEEGQHVQRPTCTVANSSLLCLEPLFLSQGGLLRGCSDGGFSPPAGSKGSSFPPLRCALSASAPSTPASLFRLHQGVSKHHKEEASAPCTPSLRREVNYTTPRHRSGLLRSSCYFSAHKPTTSIKRVLEEDLGSASSELSSCVPSTPRHSRRPPPNPFADASPALPSSGQQPSSPARPTSSHSTSAAAPTAPVQQQPQPQVSVPAAPLQQAATASQQKCQPPAAPCFCALASAAATAAAVTARALDSSFLSGLAPVCAPKPSLLPVPDAVCSC